MPLGCGQSLGRPETRDFKASVPLVASLEKQMHLSKLPETVIRP
ncbi:hypothetical protein PH7735_03183 [Shimia thalassica]|uniref:Uncharacterized protein n=1 Tax=Shimia thalassica TaxID=1715693 RepID=A0A0P1IE95_9RHOB|nr:hypothetical protein PH7735_03183 [Shimia thalassica]